MLIISGDRLVSDYIENNQFFDVQILKRNTPVNKIRSVITSVLDPSARVKSAVKKPLIIGNSPDILRLRKLIPKINQTKEVVLIEGEPGTGKELFASVLHSDSDWRDNLFLKINAVKLPYQLLDGELFGYRGFDFAKHQRKKNGMLLNARKITLFIKRVEALPLSLQAKIVQLLDNGGDAGENPEPHIRLIVSAAKNLSALAGKGVFSKELLFRLKVLHVTIPPLRKRVGDIPLLTDFLAYKYCLEFGESYRQISTIAKDSFSNYRWPGNIKELATVIRQVIIAGDEEVILKRLHNVGHQKQKKEGAPLNDPTDSFYSQAKIKKIMKDVNNYSLKSIRDEFVAATEKKLIEKVLIRYNWNRKKAAEILEISYKSLLNKIKTFNI